MNFTILQMKGIQSIDPRVLKYGDEVKTMFLVYVGHFNPPKLLGIAKSIEEVNKLVSDYLDPIIR